MEMPKPHEMSRSEKIAETKRLIDMYNRDLADAAEGMGRLSAEDEAQAKETVEKLTKELEELERGA